MTQKYRTLKRGMMCLIPQQPYTLKSLTLIIKVILVFILNLVINTRMIVQAVNTGTRKQGLNLHTRLRLRPILKNTCSTGALN
jgi:hypothetical protein